MGGARDTRRFIRRLGLVALVVLVSLLFSGLSAQARELLRDRFDRVRPDVPIDNGVKGKDGARRGFSLKKETKPFRDAPMAFHDIPVAFDNTSVRGAISFDIQRNDGTANLRRRTLFELLDAGGRQILAFQLRWKSDFDPRFAMIYIGGEDYWVNGSGLWSQQILLDREVALGQWIHVDIAWDDGARKYALYVDGRPQDVTPRAYDAKSHTVAPDPRLDNAMRRRRRDIPPPSLVAKPFSYFLSRVRTFRIGVNSHPGTSHVVSSFLSQSVLDNFTVLADEWPTGASDAPKIRSLADDTFAVPGISGKLVAGDKVTVTLVASPAGKASVDMGKVKGVALSELAPTSGGPGVPAVDNGTYRGSYTIRPGDDYENGRIVGHFVSADNVAADNVASASKWTIDTRPRVSFAIDKTDLSADEKSTSRIKLSAKDANGTPIRGRRLKLTLATTDEYTGLVGSGTTRSREIAKAVKDSLGGATVETHWRGETDSWGEVEFDYTSGFAAKTVILQVKDLESGGVSVDYITSYKEASIDIALTPPVSMAAARRGLMYVIKIEATRTWLTADGRSRSVIRATVLDPSGKAVAGDGVSFSLSSPNGSLRAISGTTDANGVATAEYTAGKKIGIVVVTALDTTRSISASVSITLLSDAPAKIHLAAKPASLPANGMSRADVNVKVTDINDNPNDNTRVEFRVTTGGGKLEYPDRVTDREGDAANRYTAGTVPGIAKIVATVRSKVPTVEELSRAQSVLFAPYSELGEEIRISRWLKRVGETALAGEPIVEYTVGRGGDPQVLAAPYDCRIDFQYVEYWDTAQTGDTLALISPAAIPGSQSPAPPAAPKLSPRRR